MHILVQGCLATLVTASWIRKLLQQRLRALS